MKTIAFIASLLFFSQASAQYYLRGEIRDEKSTPLANAKIVVHSTGYIYHSGSSGSFGITTSNPVDSATISLDGYHTIAVKLDARKYESVVLKMLYSAAEVRKNKLLSFTKNLTREERENWTVGGETYSSLVENEFVAARKYPETGFAIHTDKASYSNIRRFLNMNTFVPPDAVRIEELLNYFNFDYTEPPPDSVFGFKSYVTNCPWNINNQLLLLNVCAKKIDPETIPPSNLVFLIDISGSMDLPNRLPLLKASFKLLVENLREKDTVSIVVYGSSTGVWLQPTSGKHKEKIRKAIEELYPGGPTPGESGIRAAYRVAKSQFIKNGNNRVILATDGDFNVGQTTEEDLEKLITQHQQLGIYLTCLGVGMGNYKDSKLEVLAKKGNGNFAYIDTEKEAEKVLVKEFTQTLYTVADDAYLDIQFNPKVVKEYRLIGYDNKYKALTDTITKVEGGEVGSGQSLVVLFEIMPNTDDPSYERNELAHVTVHFKNPGDRLTRTMSYKCNSPFTEFEEIPPCYRFAASVTMFASLLKGSKYLPRGSWSDAFLVANENYDTSDAVQTEFMEMITKARKIYSRKRKGR